MTTYRIRNHNKLHRAQVGVILAQLGIPLKQQPGNVTKLREMANAFEDKDPEAFKEAFELVVNGNRNQKAEKVIPIGEVSGMLTEVVKQQERNAVNEIAGEFKNAQSEIIKAIRKETSESIQREAKKFNRIEVVSKRGKEPKQIDGVVPEQFPRLLQLAQGRKNILMVGPAGCGKTHVAAMVADALDLDYSGQSMSAGVSESVMTGWLIPIGKSGQFVYVSSEFVRIYENGGLFLFDEMDAADPNMLTFLNQALANDGFTVAQRHEKPFVKKHKDFVAIAAANTFGQGADQMYHGRNALDEATLDRFRIGTVFMNYSPIVEEKIIRSDVLAWGRAIRAKCEQHKMLKLVSTRILKDIQDMMNDFDWTIEEAEEGFFAAWSPEEKRMVEGYKELAARLLEGIEEGSENE